MVESFKRLSKRLKSLPKKIMRSEQAPFPTMSCPVGGRIGIAPCPGINGNLDDDLDAIQKWGATIVVSLVEHHELKKAGAGDIGEQLKSRNIQWYHLPIKDCSVPDQEVRPLWLDLKPLLKYRLSNKKERIILHCWAGCGRAGMIAAKLLTQCGMTTDEAVHHVRSVKPDAIDTFAQIQWLGVSSW